MVVSHFQDGFGIQRDDQVFLRMLVLLVDNLHITHRFKHDVMYILSHNTPGFCFVPAPAAFDVSPSNCSSPSSLCPLHVRPSGEKTPETQGRLEHFPAAAKQRPHSFGGQLPAGSTCLDGGSGGKGEEGDRVRASEGSNEG